MVACFRYALIDVFSVYLPPAKVDFTSNYQDWIQIEADEVVEREDLLLSEVRNAIKQIWQKKYGELCTGTISLDLRLAAFEEILQKTELEDMHLNIFNSQVKLALSFQDILEINRLRRHLLVESYLWDQRLIDAAKGENQNEDIAVPIGDLTGSSILTGPSNAVIGGEALLMDQKFLRSSNLEEGCKIVVKPLEAALPTRARPDLTCDFEDQGDFSLCIENYEQCDPPECGSTTPRALSDSQFASLSDTLDAARTGKTQPGIGSLKDESIPLTASFAVDSSLAIKLERLLLEHQAEENDAANATACSSPAAFTNSKGSDSAEDFLSRLGMPFLNFYRSFNQRFLESDQKLDKLCGYKSMYISSARELGQQCGAKWLLPKGLNETIIPIYDDEPTSMISYALASLEYYLRLSDDGEKSKDIKSASSMSLQESASFHQFPSLGDPLIESNRSLSIDESFLSTSRTHNSFLSDPLLYTKSLHIRVSFPVNGPIDKMKHTVTCYYAKHFDALRKICCPSELDYIRSLSRCKKWGAQGGKSNVFFAKTLDDRFIIKQVTKTELESFIKFAPGYFRYLTESINAKSPTCLAKILGIYQVASRNLKGGKESKMDVLVMENLLFKRNVTRLYDLKGSSRSRYNPDSSGSNKVLLDQNLIEAMPTSPIFVGHKAKHLLGRAVWNDTNFLANADVMDYSLLVGVDEEKHELVVGIIDFLRQYTWDKHLETWVKASGILGGSKNEPPTVISPKQYKLRFRKSMTTYFLLVPDYCSPSTITSSKSESPSTITSSKSESNLGEENA